MWLFRSFRPLQFVTYVDSVDSGSPMDMDTDGPLLDDVSLLKKTVEEEAKPVRSHRSLGNTLQCVCVVQNVSGLLHPSLDLI